MTDDDDDVAVMTESGEGDKPMPTMGIGGPVSDVTKTPAVRPQFALIQAPELRTEGRSASPPPVRVLNATPSLLSMPA